MQKKDSETHIHTCNGVFRKVFVSWELHFNPIKPSCMPHGLTHYTAQTITRCWVRYMCPFWNTVLLDLQTARRLRTSRPNSARPLKVHSLLLDCYNLSVFFLPAVSSVIKCKSMHLTCDLCAVPYHLFYFLKIFYQVCLHSGSLKFPKGQKEHSRKNKTVVIVAF